jgi:hypothetical protein
VDVRLGNFSETMTSLLPWMTPMADSSNSVTRRGIDTGMQSYMINATATNDSTYAGMHDYEVYVKLSREDETKWRQFHPQIQIDRDGTLLWKIIAAVVAVVMALVGFLAGRSRGEVPLPRG